MKTVNFCSNLSNMDFFQINKSYKSKLILSFDRLAFSLSFCKVTVLLSNYIYYVFLLLAFTSWLKQVAINYAFFSFSRVYLRRIVYYCIFLGSRCYVGLAFFRQFKTDWSFNQLPKSIGSFLAVDRMYCWLRNRAKN